MDDIMNNYPSFPSIERVENVYIVISEKIDGTNGLIELCGIPEQMYPNECPIKFGSRNRYISIEDDNYGFANFFTPHIDKILIAIKHIKEESESEIDKVCIQRIYGEWFGQGIQRTYNLKERFFMPFSTFYAEKMIEAGVPNIIKPYIFYAGKENEAPMFLETLLKDKGSYLIPGYMHPEGLVYHYPKYNKRVKNIIEGNVPKVKKKTQHDLKPEEICKKCGKRLYLIKNGDGILKCKNFYCKENLVTLSCQ